MAQNFATLVVGTTVRGKIYRMLVALFTVMLIATASYLAYSQRMLANSDWARLIAPPTVYHITPYAYALAKGDEVVTAGGMLGKVTSLAEGFVTLQVANGVEVQMQRSSVVQVLPKGTIK